ncbi:MAG: LytTR family DNA-binding domain-containing protein [Xanthomonadales bacterium]|nr:LytTR family DNA-binding domain-containing protein [Xanthomonadales bacterium]
MTIRVLIADDEPLARDLLAQWVRQDPRLRLVGEATDGEEALDLLEKTRAQLLFLDIKMPGPDGVETLRAIRSRNLQPYVVFVTAWDQHAVKAYDLAAGDYLVKPVRKSRFAQAVRRAVRALEARGHYDSLNNALPPLLVREGDRTTPVAPASIIWVEAASQYARVHTGRSQHLVSRPLADVASELPDTQFLRVHRSALVNLACIRHLRSDRGSYHLELSNGDVVPVARSRRKEVLSKLRPSGAPADA